ncbi:hypothetical protein [Novosphingobium sp.]|uniref:hypothetical protein n=1 Tax=Novosphingobium sp. TaxID=1874826 RepID=UPI0038BAFC89
MARRVTGAFGILLASRVFGILRELLISVAFGFSAITDLFYQSTLALTALLTVTNGPFTTAFAARLNQAAERDRLGHVLYYRRFATRVGMVLGGLYALAALVLFIVPGIAPQGGWLALLVLVPGALFLGGVGFWGAVAIALGRVVTSAVLMFLMNGAFVSAVLAVWLLHLPLASWMLPLCYSVGTLVAALWTQRVADSLAASFAPAAPDGGVAGRAAVAAIEPRPLPGLYSSFLYAGSETLVFLFTQFLVVAMATHAGPGWVSGSSLAQRVCFSVNGLIISPYASLLMLDVMRRGGNRHAFLRGVLLALTGLVSLALVLNFAVLPVLQFFAGTRHAMTLAIFSQILPAFSLWMIPLGCNVIVCRVMFGLGLERTYTAVTIGGYLVANALRAIISFKFHMLTIALAAGAVVELGAVLFLITYTARALRHRAAVAVDEPGEEITA